MEKKDEKIGAALRKVALGYQLAEVTEEYAEVDGELKLTKRKKTKKDVPPDLKAVQLLLGAQGGADLEKMSDEELESEKRRLLSALENSIEHVAEKTTKKEGQVCVEKSSIAKKARPKPRKRVVRKKKTEEKHDG